ncbi:SH3 domain-containing protein [Thalassospira lucentensis]|uniref:SH3 domain-containing protein n=1 Tax=Thalassospira lucentensis TaxID=168935 RepID=UPI00142DCCF0|nr:SH3 domain-containing protein [Thalassospira lucentensis]NIZ03537.1 SH3 domain-containing protein [Thalassospira lucentensis]
MSKAILRGTTALAMMSVLALGGCDKTTGQTIGSIVGVVGGTVLGAQFGKGTGQLVATAIGATAGYLIGDWVGEMLDPKDTEAVQQTTIKTLDAGSDGQAVTWNNPDTGARAEITPTNTRQVTAQVEVKRPKVVASPVGMTIIGDERVILKGANVRAAPTTDASILRGLRSQTPVNVIGSVKNGNWYLIGQDGKAIGYVYHTLVGQTASAPAVQTATADAPNDPDAQKVAEEEIVASDDNVIDLDAEFETETLMVQTTCRDLSMKVSDGSETEQQNYSACKSPDGVWELG